MAFWDAQNGFSYTAGSTATELTGRNQQKRQAFEPAFSEQFGDAKDLNLVCCGGRKLDLSVGYGHTRSLVEDDPFPNKRGHCTGYSDCHKSEFEQHSIAVDRQRAENSNSQQPRLFRIGNKGKSPADRSRKFYGSFGRLQDRRVV